MNMKSGIKLGVVMDPIDRINPSKDSTLAILLEAQKRDWTIHYMTQNDLFLQNAKPMARMRCLKVKDDLHDWFEYAEPVITMLDQLDIILMRKDPPFNIEYIYTTYILEQAEKRGVLIINKPQSLRDANEKLFTIWFPQCCPDTLISSDAKIIKEFVAEHNTVVFKPLEGMGGKSIFLFNKDSPNINVTIETLTNFAARPIMIQRYIPAITEKGDKRILMINGEPIESALARFPTQGEFRSNLAVGGRGIAVKISERDRWICNEVGPTLREKGLIFVGLDVIGDYLTEINVTSPTCIRELDTQCALNISANLLDSVEELLPN